MSRQSRGRLGHIRDPARARMLGHRPAAASLSPELWYRHILADENSFGRSNLVDDVGLGCGTCTAAIVEIADTSPR